MRILLASDFYPPFLGGTERQVQLLARELTRRGHLVTIVTPWQRGLKEKEIDSGATVYRAKALSISVPWFFQNPQRRFHPPFPDPSIVWTLRKLIKRYKPDVVHAFGWIAYSCALAVGISKKRAPLLISAQDYGYSCATRILLHQRRACDGPAVLKCLVCSKRRYGTPKAMASVAGVFSGKLLLTKRADAIHGLSTFVSGITRRDLLGNRSRIVQPTLVTIPPVVMSSDESFYTSGRAADDCRSRLPAEPYILFVGALAAHKGIESILAAYERLSPAPPLVLIGTLWPDSPHEFPEGITVLHNVPPEGVMTAWENCLFGLAPSVFPEPFGMVITEAMSTGKAVISTSVGGPADIVVHGETGLLTPPNDVEALTEAMQQLVVDASFRERLGRAARARARLFEADVILPRFESLYQQLRDGFDGAQE